MTTSEAISLLKLARYDEVSETRIFNGGPWVCWNQGDREVCLDGDFPASELEAMITLINASQNPI